MDSHVGEYRALGGDVESKKAEAQRFKQILKSTTKKFQRRDSQEAATHTYVYIWAEVKTLSKKI